MMALTLPITSLSLISAVARFLVSSAASCVSICEAVYGSACTRSLREEQL